MLVVGFFAMLAACLFILVTRKPMQLAGMPSHDLVNRLQSYISEMDSRFRDMPQPREIRALSDRVRALETVTTGMQSDVRALRDSSKRIEHQLDLLMSAGLERDARGAST